VLAGLALLCVVDFALAGSPRRISVERTLPAHVVEGRPADVALTLTAPRRARVELVHSLPLSALATDAEPDVTGALDVEGGARTTWTAPATFVRRGAFPLGRVTLRTRGPLGLVRRRARTDPGGELRVLPDVARIGARADRLLRGLDADAGKRRRAHHEGRELDSLREYVRGDDPRFIEWKASARRGELVMKKMRPETRQDLLVVLDTGRQLSGAHAPVDGGDPRVDVAVTTALTLGAAGLWRGDRVGLLAFAGDVRAIVPVDEGRGHLRALALSTFDLRALPEESDYGEVARTIAARQKRRAMVCFVTDVVDEPSARALAAAIVRLRGRHVPVVIALGDPALLRLERHSSELTEAARLLLQHRRRALAALEAAGAVVVDAPAPKAAALAVQSYVELKAQGRV
jgi:uncharacterized protein (DUF58 family)